LNGWAGDIVTLDPAGAKGRSAGMTLATFGGTSAAAPMVAAIAAEIWSRYPALSAKQVRTAIEESATILDPVDGLWKNDKSKFYGHGLIQAGAAIKYADELIQSDTTDSSTIISINDALNSHEKFATASGLEASQTDFIAFVVSEDDRETLANITELTIGDEARDDPGPKMISIGDDRAAYLVAKSLLTKPSISKHSKIANIRPMPVLQDQQGSLIIPTGDIVLQFEDNESATNLERRINGEAIGKAKVLGRYIMLTPNSSTNFKQIIELKERFASEPGVVNANFDFAVDISDGMVVDP
jgi:hypothetical protein